MRSVALSAGPRALRIGVVRDGRIVAERILEPGAPVQIGSTEDATFVVALPRLHELFSARAGRYVLRAAAGMTGRVALESEVVAFEGPREIPLSEDARGKIVIGDTTFLFQLVRPAPRAAKPQLPLAVKGGFANQIDWSLTIIAAMSFLVHFGIVGAMYSDWMDVVVDDNHSVAGIVDMMKNIPTPPVTETPTMSDAPTVADTPTAKPTTPTTTHASNHSTSTTHSSSPSVSDRQAAALAAQADSLQLNILAATNANSSVEGTLRRSDIPPVDLSNSAAANTGAARSTNDLHLQGGNSTTGARPGGGLATMAGDTHGTSQSNAGPERALAAPKVEPQIGALSGGANVTGADRVIAGLRTRFKTCYQKGLASDPTMQGKVIIAAKIGPNGEVISSDIASNTGLSPEVGQCIATAIKRAQFDAQAGSTSLSVPVSFIHQTN